MSKESEEPSPKVLEDSPLVPSEREENNASEPPAQLREFFGMVQRTSRHLPHPLFDKFDSDHVHKFLDYCQRGDDYSFEFAKSNRWFTLAYVLLVVFVLGLLLVYLLPRNEPLLVDILKVAAGFASGFGAGYGWSKARQNR